MKDIEARAPFSRRAFLGSVAFLLPGGRALLAQEQQPQQQPQKTFSAEVKVVNVLATVRNHKGEIIRDLSKDGFQLEEDGRPQTIGYFSRETNLPLTLGLLVDTSGSQRRVLSQERQASFRFLDQVLHEDKDLAFLIHFDREVELLQDLTSSRKNLESALALLEGASPQPANRGNWPGPRGGGQPGPRGGGGGGGRQAGTLLYDAVLLAADELMKKQAGRKALIVLSDGVDIGSKMTLADAVESAQRADTLVYSILFADEQAYGGGFGPGRPGMGGRRGGPPARMPQQTHPDGKKILERISKATGGGLFQVSKKHPIEEVYSRIEEELRNQYNLGYSPDRPDAAPGYHKIHLTTKQKGLVVQAREGYYAM
jgi:VWFA-related protein